MHATYLHEKQTAYFARKPTGYGSSSRRLHHKGIVDECCFQSCDLRRLEMYCAPIKPPKSARSVRAQRHTDMPKAQKKTTKKACVNGDEEGVRAKIPQKFIDFKWISKSLLQWTAATVNNPGASVYRLVQSLQKAVDNNPPIWIVNTKEANICQSNLADSNRPSFMGITRHTGIEYLAVLLSINGGTVSSADKGFLPSVSKSLQEVEDEDMLLTTLNLGKTLRNRDKIMNRGAIPLLKYYKTEDSIFFNEKNDENMKLLSSGVCWEESIDLVGKHENY
ncbi:hypothetical protein WISP_81548 [Willisornis vidua]|uniref:Insulin-like domain-containing protein n=3 Tax=Passeriformes TaxID=9126 RepID=A0ABQ9D9U2_9PASS|nr:hypothetical protein WISP_81548 [Willisornis vidua]